MTPAATLCPSTAIRSPIGSTTGARAAAMAIATTIPTTSTLKAIGHRLRLAAS
jgi:hypothetical protein